MFLKSRNNKSIKGWLIKNYLILLLIGIICAFAAEVIINISVDYVFTKKLEISNIYAYPYENIDTSIVKSMGGWVEILDENKKVIKVLGEKKDDKTSYNEEDFFNNIMLKDDVEKPNYYSIYVIKNRRDEGAYCVAIIPKKSAKLIVLPSYLPHTNTFMLYALIIYLGMFFLFFAFGMILYSYISANQIKKPLQEIMFSMGEIKKQNYKVRLFYDAEDEFMEIRDTFNHMAEKLQNMEEQKQRLFADITHDLNTPITSIMGYAKILYDGKIKDAETQKEYLKTIYQKSARVCQLVRNLFDFSKVSDESLLFELRRNDFSEWLRQLISSVYFEIVQSGFLIDIDIPDEPIYVNFDEKQMIRVVINLIDNALKYNPAGTKLAISCKREEHRVILRVCDNGLGIPQELKNKIFEPFVRGENARSTKGGTGLGLSIAEKIIARHGGNILVTSDNVYNTVFKIDLPICR